jgi:hypothetical protein
MNLFVLVSTGQRVANLPPVLEHATVGDQMLWIESDEARRGNWTAAPLAILEDRGLVLVRPVIQVQGVNDPVALSNVLSPFAREFADQYKNVFLVANGGTKLTPVGLLSGLGSLAPQILYGDERPAVHSLYPRGLAAAPSIEAYTRHDLDLGDILRVNGYTFATDNAHIRFWPEQFTVDWAAEVYGVNESFTYNLHAVHHARATAPQTDTRVPFASLPTLVPDMFARWNRTVGQVRERLNPQNLEALYNSTLKMDERARLAAGASAVAPRPPRIDDAFERAVARRVRTWLLSTRHPAIRSAWANVSVARENSPHKHEAQFDILLVLTNGVLMHLECKSALVDVRDLDARIHRLRETGSQLARLAVVLPLYTRQVSQLWFRTLHSARLDVEHARLTLLPFTWPGQPGRYIVPDSDPVEEAECPEFEGTLERLLQPYRT